MGLAMMSQLAEPFRRRAPRPATRAGGPARLRGLWSDWRHGRRSGHDSRLTFTNGRWLTLTWECFNALAAAEPIGNDYSPSSGLTLRAQAPLIFPSFGVEAGF